MMSKTGTPSSHSETYLDEELVSRLQSEGMRGRVSERLSSRLCLCRVELTHRCCVHVGACRCDDYLVFERTLPTHVTMQTSRLQS